MPSAPWLAPLLAAFVAGTLAGFSITLAMVTVIGRLRAAAHGRRAESVRWLAARIVFSRETISLLAAMRALKTGGESAALQKLRMAEAQRARAAWFAARRELDRAAAALEGWYAAHGECRIFVTDETDGAIRKAIEGDDAAAARMVHSLRAADAAAREWVHAALRPKEALFISLARDAIKMAVAPFRGVLRAWSARD